MLYKIKLNNIVILKTTWSPKLCLFEKIENLNPINNEKYDIY